jgi:hypothetical protein
LELEYDAATVFGKRHGMNHAIFFSHFSRASCQVWDASPPHLSRTVTQVRLRIISSTIFSCLIIEAKASVRDSRGKKRPEYGSSLLFTIFSRSFSLSISRSVALGSSGSELAATRLQYLSTLFLACQDGNRMLSWNVWQARGSIFRDGDLTERWAVESGSNPERAGVASALRFWTIESSMLDLESRKKSAEC